MSRQTLRRSRGVESAVGGEELGVQHGPARRSTNGVVPESNHPQIEHRVAPHAPDRHRHSAAGVYIALGLRTIRSIGHNERMLRPRRESIGRRQSLPRPHCFDRRFRRRLLLEADRHADRVAMFHGDTVGVGAHLERRARHLAILVLAKELQHLPLELGLFVGDVGNDVAEYVERWHAGVTGARHSLHRGKKKLPDSELLMQRRESDSGHRGRTVRVGHDGAAPAAAFPLAFDESKVVAVHLWNHERDIRLHAEILGVAEHEFSGLGERQLHLARHHGVERREHYWRAHDARITRNHAARLERLRRGWTFQPARRLDVFLSRRSLRRRELDYLEPRMVGQHAHEHLPHRAGGAEHCYRPLVLALSWNRPSRHLARSVWAIFSYLSTLTLSSSTSMYSSGV